MAEELPPITKETFSVWRARLEVALKILDEALDRDDGSLTAYCLDEIAYIGGPLSSGGNGVLLMICSQLISKEAQRQTLLEVFAGTPVAVPIEKRYKSAAELHGFTWTKAA